MSKYKLQNIALCLSSINSSNLKIFSYLPQKYRPNLSYWISYRLVTASDLFAAITIFLQIPILICNHNHCRINLFQFPPTDNLANCYHSLGMEKLEHHVITHKRCSIGMIPCGTLQIAYIVTTYQLSSFSVFE